MYANVCKCIKTIELKKGWQRQYFIKNDNYSVIKEFGSLTPIRSSFEWLVLK